MCILCNIDNCVHRDFPCPSGTDSCSPLSPQLCYARSNYPQRCSLNILCVRCVQKFFAKTWTTPCKDQGSGITYRMLRPLCLDQCSCSFVYIGSATSFHHMHSVNIGLQGPSNAPFSKSCLLRDCSITYCNQKKMNKKANYNCYLIVTEELYTILKVAYYTYQSKKDKIRDACAYLRLRLHCTGAVFVCYIFVTDQVCLHSTESKLFLFPFPSTLYRIHLISC